MNQPNTAWHPIRIIFVCVCVCVCRRTEELTFPVQVFCNQRRHMYVTHGRLRRQQTQQMKQTFLKQNHKTTSENMQLCTKVRGEILPQVQGVKGGTEVYTPENNNNRPVPPEKRRFHFCCFSAFFTSVTSKAISTADNNLNVKLVSFF